MKKLIDMATVVAEPDELLDAELVSMFPKGRTRIADSVLIQDGGRMWLVTKDEIARQRKLMEDMARRVAYGGCICSIWAVIGLMVFRVMNPLLGCPAIGAVIVAMGGLEAWQRYRW